MNKEMGLVALREISRDEFLVLAQNGARELFELGHYKVFDGLNGRELSHFVYNMGTHSCYLIDKDTCYELVTDFYCGGNQAKVSEHLNQIASSIK